MPWIVGPERVHATVTEAALRRHADDILRRRAVERWRWVGPVVRVYVNDARWLIDCPNCNAGISVRPDWDGAVCMHCGAEFAGRQLVWPDVNTRQALEAVLGARPERFRNWFPPEPVEALEDENVTHGFPRRRTP